jgi:hypothetical protein
MNTLWASLIGLILIALAVVLGFNFMQGRQTRLRDAWREKLAGGGRRSPPSSPPSSPEPPPDADRQPAAGRSGASAAVPSAPAPARRIEPSFDAGRDRLDPPAEPVAAWHAAASETPVPADRWGADGHAPGGVRDDADPAGALEPDAANKGAVHADPTASRRGLTETGPVLDPRLDCIVELGLVAPIAPDRLLSAIATLRRAGSKPVAIEADAGDGRWTIPHATRGALRRVRAGVLLANRNGPLNAMEYSEFSTAVQALGRTLGAGGATVPDMAPVLEHARQLDDACAQLDAVIGLNVETPTALSPAELSALASGLGLVERGNNRYAQLGENGDVLFSLSLGERAEQLTLLLDVPRASPDAEPWPMMVDCAMQCAERTGGRLVDDAGRPLTEPAVSAVARQLAQRYRSLEEAGLDAGSAAALRVFN